MAMAAKLSSRLTIRRLLYATLWFCVCFALARNMPFAEFWGYAPPPDMLGGQARQFFTMALAILGLPFGAGIGAIFGKTAWGAMLGPPAGLFLGFLITDSH